MQQIQHLQVRECYERGNIQTGVPVEIPPPLDGEVAESAMLRPRNSAMSVSTFRSRVSKPSIFVWIIAISALISSLTRFSESLTIKRILSRSASVNAASAGITITQKRMERKMVDLMGMSPLCIVNHVCFLGSMINRNIHLSIAKETIRGKTDINTITQKSFIKTLTIKNVPPEVPELCVCRQRLLARGSRLHRR